MYFKLKIVYKFSFFEYTKCFETVNMYRYIESDCIVLFQMILFGWG